MTHNFEPEVSFEKMDSFQFRTFENKPFEYINILPVRLLAPKKRPDRFEFKILKTRVRLHLCA